MFDDVQKFRDESSADPCFAGLVGQQLIQPLAEMINGGDGGMGGEVLVEPALLLGQQALSRTAQQRKPPAVL